MRVLLVACMLSAGISAQTPGLADLAEQLLRTNGGDRTTRLQAALFVPSARRLPLGCELAESGNWRVRLAAVDLFAVSGREALVKQAVTAFQLHVDDNWLVRRQVYARLRNAALDLPDDVLARGLTDSNWQVRAATLECLVPHIGSVSPTELSDRVLELVTERTKDNDKVVRGRAWDLLCSLAGQDDRVFQFLWSSSWSRLESRSRKRRILLVFMDRAAQETLPKPPMLREGEGGAFRSFQDLLTEAPGAGRVKRVIQAVVRPSFVEEVGEHHMRALLRFVASDPAWHREIAQSMAPGGARAELVERLLKQAPRPAFSSGLLEAAAGLDHFDEVILQEAWQLKPREMAGLLEAWFVEDARRGASRRRLRRLMKFRHALIEPIKPEFLLEGLSQGGFAQRVVITEQIWRRESESLRKQLLKRLPEVFDGPTRRSLRRIIAETARPEAADLYRSMLNDEQTGEDLRVLAFDALAKLGILPDVARLRPLLAGAGANLEDRLLRRLISQRDLQTINQLKRRLLQSPGTSADLMTLNRLRSVADRETATFVTAELRAGRFSSATLAPLLQFLHQQIDPARFRSVFADFLTDAVERSADERRHTGFERLDGAVLEHLLRQFDPAASMQDLYRLASCRAIEGRDRVLLGLLALAQRRGEVENLALLMKESWERFGPGIESLEQRSYLAQPMVLTGSRTAVEPVTRWLTENGPALLSHDPEQEDEWYGAIAFDGIVSNLVSEGSTDALEAVLSLFARLETELLRRRFQQVVEASVPGDEEFEVATAFLVGTLTALGRDSETHRRLDQAWGSFRSSHLPGLPLGFWLAWSRHIARFPRGGQPSALVADRLVEAGLHLMEDGLLLLALGKRSLDDGGSAGGARVWLAGRRFHGRAEKDGELWRLQGRDPFSDYWNDCRALSLVGKLSWPQLLPHRRHDDAMASFVTLAADLDPDLNKALRFVRDAAAGSRAPGHWAALEVRLLLDQNEYAEAVARALLAEERVTVFGPSARMGSRARFACLRAAALWGLERREDARRLLRRHGIRDLRHLDAGRPEDFPGF